MEWLNDAKACIDVADHMLDEAKELQGLAVSDESYIPFLKVKIKNFLENCRSPLDYSAQYAFDTYCKKEYTKKERSKIKVYFPIRQTQDEFDILINDNFRGLSTTKPEFLEVFAQAQVFNSNSWLQDLNRLVNKNKHRHLTKHAIQRKAEVERFEVRGGVFINSTFINNGTDISIDGNQYNFGDMNPPQGINFIGAKVSYDFTFTDLSKSVVPVLQEIHAGSKNLITNLELRL